MQFVALGVAALSLAAIYYIWRTYREVKTHRDRILRERIAYMIWVASESAEASARK